MTKPPPHRLADGRGNVQTLEQGEVYHFPAAGRCIYCGVRDGLTDEHIVPYGLNGRFVLPKASCESCSRITSAFELRALRNNYGIAREKLAMPSRSKKKKRAPAHRMFPATIRGVPGSYKASEFPGILGGIIWPAPRILTQAPREAMWLKLWMSNSLPAPIDQGGSFEITTEFNISDQPRLIAKIAHGFAFAEGTLEGFEPLLPDFILDKSPDLWDYLVGGEVDIENSPAMKETEHLIGTGVVSKEGWDYLVATVTLFANRGAPPYAAVVGRRRIPGWAILHGPNRTAAPERPR